MFHRICSRTSLSTKELIPDFHDAGRLPSILDARSEAARRARARPVQEVRPADHEDQGHRPGQQSQSLFLDIKVQGA